MTITKQKKTKNKPDTQCLYCEKHVLCRPKKNVDVDVDDDDVDVDVVLCVKWFYIFNPRLLFVFLVRALSFTLLSIKMAYSMPLSAFNEDRPAKKIKKKPEQYS